MSKLGIFLVIILVIGLVQSGIIWWLILALIVIAAIVLYLVHKITESKKYQEKYQAMTDPHILYQDECYKNTPPYIGNKRTKVAHVYYCKDIENINPENQVHFPNMQEALFRGYSLHSNCHD